MRAKLPSNKLTILRLRISEVKLDAAAKDVYYEIEQMILAANRWRTAGSDAHLWNLLIEAFLLHYRNIRDFLFPVEATLTMPPGRRVKNREAHEDALDTVIAYDFASVWRHQSTQYTGLEAGERKRINKRLAHISYSRQQLGEGWDIPGMAKLLCDKFNEFLELLPEGQSRLEPVSRLIGQYLRSLT